MDLSWTFGTTIILGISSYTSGNGSMVSDGINYSPTTTEGMGLLGVLRYQFSIVEVLGGMRHDDVSYKELKSSSGSSLTTDQNIKANTMIIGLGLIF